MKDNTITLDELEDMMVKRIPTPDALFRLVKYDVTKYYDELFDGDTTFSLLRDDIIEHLSRLIFVDMMLIKSLSEDVLEDIGEETILPIGESSLRDFIKERYDSARRNFINMNDIEVNK